MKLQIDYINIKSVEFGSSTALQGSVLTINKEDLISQIDTSYFESVDIIIARPGEDVRILGLADSTQPRVKADDPDATFPGYLGKMVPAGDGRTVALKGVLVSELYPLKANFKNIIDMKGAIADISMLSRHNHIVLDLRPKEGIDGATYCHAQKTAALKLSVHLAKLGIKRAADSTGRYELRAVKPGPDGKPLPKIAYLTAQWAGFDVQQFFYYGQSGIGMLPTLVHPNEMLDGALVYRYFQPTYYYQEEAIIKELCARHGKDIEFVGVVLTAGKTEITAKEASSMEAAVIARNYLKADITINTMAGMGHVQLEQQMFHLWSEKLGMKAVSVIPGVSVEKPGDTLVISESAVDAIVHNSSGPIMEYPRVETLIGLPDVPALMAHDLRGPFVAPTNLTVHGIYSKQGASYVTDDLDLITEGWRRP